MRSARSRQSADRLGGQRAGGRRRRRAGVRAGRRRPSWCSTPGQTVKLTRANCSTAAAGSCAKKRPSWSLEGLKGTVTDGAFTVGGDPVEQAGLIKATVGGLTGEARARVVRPLPWNETFESLADGAAPPGWVNASGRQVSVATLDGQKVLQKAPDEHASSSASASFIGPVDWSNYTFEADVRATDAAPADGRRRHHRAALFARALRHDAAAQARAVGAGNAAHGDRAVRVEARHVVPTRSCASRTCRTAQVRARGKAWPTGEAGAGGVDDRQDRSDR